MSLVEDCFFWDNVSDINDKMFLARDMAKKNIATDFLNRARVAHSQLNIKDTNDLDKIYSIWSRENENSLSQKISKELEKMIKTKIGEIKITGADFNAPKNPILEERYIALKDELDQRINAMLNILEDTDGIFQKAALEACIGKEITDPELRKKYKNGDIVSLGQGAGAEALQALQKLRNDLDILSGINKNGTLSADYKGKDVTPDLVADKIAGALSSIAGEAIYEPLVIMVVNELLKKEKEINKEVLDALQINVNGSFFNINTSTITGIASQSSDVGIKGSQGKPDFYIKWNNGTIEIVFAGSIKFKQGVSRTFTKSGLPRQVSYSANIGQMINYLNQDVVYGFKGALAAILKAKGQPWGGGYADSSEYSSAWDAMKDSLLYKLILDKFVGDASTNSFGEINFADFIVVNQYLLSFWDVIKNISNAGESQPFGSYMSITGEGKNWKFNNNNFDYWKNRKYYWSPSKKDRIFYKTMNLEQQQLFDSMWQKIMSKEMQINLFVWRMIESNK